MKKYLISAVAVLLSLMWGSSIFGLSDTLTVPIYTRSGLRINFDLDLQENPGVLVPMGRTDTTVTYSSGPYQIQVIESAQHGGSVIRVVVTTTSRQPFWTTSFSVTARAPRESIQGVWYPSAVPSPTNVMSADADHSVSGISGANYGIPYIAGASGNLGSVFAMGLGRQDLPVSITGRPAGSEYEFRLTATTLKHTVVFDESFYVSGNTPATWFEAASDYAAWVDELNQYQQFPISETAYEPVYDTWYWSKDHVDDRLYMETARLAREAGFGLYLADSGWDAPAGEYDKWLSGRTGDYNPPPDKFGNLPATFSAIRSEEKLGIDLWLQPFAVGRESSRYADTRDLHIRIPTVQNPLLGWAGLTFAPLALPFGQNLETVNLCPRMAATETYLQNLFAEMARRYHPDGYWLDFIDGLANYCVAPHTHTSELFGEGLNQSLATIKRTILSSNPAATVHFRSPYANLNTKSFASIWQSEDSPGDFDQMRLSSIRMRPFSKGVVMASDQLYWPEGTNEVQASKFIVTSVMVGVPAFGANLGNLPPSTLEMLKAWLSFYRQHQTELINGRFSPFGRLERPNHKIETADRTFAYLRNLEFSDLRTAGKTIFLVNATDADFVAGKLQGPAGIRTYQVEVFNRFLVAEPNPLRLRTDRNGVLNFNVAVPQGGLAILSAIEPANDLLDPPDDDSEPIEPSPELTDEDQPHVHPASVPTTQFLPL
jgi:alpha-galactosidase